MKTLIKLFTIIFVILCCSCYHKNKVGLEDYKNDDYIIVSDSISSKCVTFGELLSRLPPRFTVGRYSLDRNIVGFNYLNETILPTQVISLRIRRNISPSEYGVSKFGNPSIDVLEITLKK